MKIRTGCPFLKTAKGEFHEYDPVRHTAHRSDFDQPPVCPVGDDAFDVRHHLCHRRHHQHRIYQGRRRKSCADHQRRGSRRAAQAVRHQGLPARRGDFSGFVGNAAEIIVTRAFPVAIRVDNTTHRVMMTEGTVADALAAAGVTVDDNDLI
ncbi:MAG: ubiquitin-like domain-containing protein, partial [Oscillospiraceae bacterium]|nr:ubiquitin-like domain-containing protein [Oscillospiraceae bacterium]